MLVLLLFALGGLGAGAIYEETKPGSAPPIVTKPGATTSAVGMVNAAATNAPAAHAAAIHFNFSQATINQLIVLALKNPNLTQAAHDFWIMKTAENPYFSPGQPGSIALGWG